MRKREMTILVCASILGAMIGGGTLAYFTDQDQVENTFTVGALDIDETEPDWEDETDGKNLIPGSVRFKNPTIKNVTTAEKGANSCYCRLIVELKDSAGRLISDSSRADKIWQTVCYDSTYQWNSTSGKGSSSSFQEGDEHGITAERLAGMLRVNPAFTEDTSGTAVTGRKIFNYTGNDGILEAGQEATLFTTIVIPTDWKQADLELLDHYSMVITAQAIQSSGFTSASQALAALASEAA